VLSVVWIGFDDNRTTRLSGANGALPIWIEYMKRVSPMIPDAQFKRPHDVVNAEIDPETGLLATPACPAIRSEMFIAGTEPAETCYLHTSYRDRYFPSLSDFPGFPREETLPDEPIGGGERPPAASRESEEEIGAGRWLDKVF
jgi:membrane carboxypeptidase/penicillin-binding protein